MNGLYAVIEDWLPDGWEIRQGAPVVSHEPLMQKFAVTAKRIPTLELSNREGQCAQFKPRALWIIGENGRVDLKRDGHFYFIVDTADNFAPPRWEVSRAERRYDREAVTGGWLRRILL